MGSPEGGCTDFFVFFFWLFFIIELDTRYPYEASLWVSRMNMGWSEKQG